VHPRLVSDRLVFASLGALFLVGLVFESCGSTPTYARIEPDGAVTIGSGGVPSDDGTGGGTGGVSAVGTGGATGPGGSVGSGGRSATGGTPAGGAGAPANGGAGGVSSPGIGGTSAAGGGSAPVGGAGGQTTGHGGTGDVGTGGVDAGGSGSGGVATGGVTASGGTSSGGVTGSGGAAGGSSAGGAPGAGGQGGAGVGGSNSSSVPTAIDCSAPSVPPALLSDFNVQATMGSRWASSSGLAGTVFAFANSTSTATATVSAAPGDLHLTASVIASSYAGGGILFDSCQSIGSYTSIRFSVSGTNTCPIWMQIQTYNLKPTTDTPQGGCASNCLNYPTVQNVAISPSPVTVPLSSFSPWSSTLAGQVVGVYWFLDTLSGGAACTTDLHFDNITLVP